MKTRWIGFSLAFLGVLALIGYATLADERRAFKARLTPFQEVPPKLTDASGTFKATVNGNSMEIELTYSDLSADALFAHIHFGQRAVNGGIFVFLCNNNPPNPAPVGAPTPPTCPKRSGTVTRTITAADILAVSSNPTANQGIAKGDFEGILRIIRRGDAYANVHTTTFPMGEIRGQIRVDDEENPD